MSKHSDRAVELFKQGYNCSQAVFVAFSDEYDMDETTALKVSSGLGGGVGRLREVCGTVTGAAMVVGMLNGATDGADNEAKAETYRIVQQIAEEFREQQGSVICRELLNSSAELKKTYVPDERTAEYYKKRPCAIIVECMAKIIDKILFGIED